jgi:hypothetical protein
MIAPLWDDLYIFQGSGQKITEKSVAGQYYSVTWDVSQFSNSVPRYQFQVVLFGGTTSINGTTYLPDDIVFAYQRVDADFYGGNATVGLNKGDGTFATLPDVESSGGLLGNSQADLLPTASQLLLLARPDGSGDYGGAFVTAVPEPSTWVLCVGGLACAAWGAMRRGGKRGGSSALAAMVVWQRRGQCRLLTASSLILVALSGGIAHAELVLSVSPGVVLSPGTATIGGVATGPLNGLVYGPVGYNGAPGGTTGFVTSTFVIPSSSSSYQLVWEVSNVGDESFPSALAIDNVRISSGGSTTVLFGFEAGIPGAFTSVAGSVSGASPAITNLSPAEGAFFAFIDTTGSYDTAMGVNGSRLISSVFSATAGDVLAIDTAFLTKDSTTSYGDYGFVALSTDGGVTPSTVLFTAVAPVPEPSTWMLCAGGLACTAYGAFRRRKRQQFGLPFIATALLTLVAAFLSADPAHAAPVTKG